MTSRTRIAVVSSVSLHLAAGALLFGAFWKSGPRIEITAVDLVETSPAVAAAPREVPEARSAPTLNEHKPAPVPATPPVVAGAASGAGASGISSPVAGNASAIAAYLALVRSKLSGEIRVPTSFEARILKSTLEMTLTSDGQIKNSKISESSGSDAFDDSVTAALRRATPFPPFSVGMGGIHEVTVKLPIEIRTRD